MDECQVNDLRDIDDVLREIGLTKDHCYFRGQTRDLPLIPSLGRMFHGKLLPEAERHLVDEFLSLYNDVERDAIYERKQDRDFRVDLTDKNSWRTLAVAQHYGLPTRLLDWSSRDLVGTYFAVRSVSIEENNSDGILYVFYDKTAIAPDEASIWPKLTVTNVRPYRAWEDGGVNLLPRVKAQEGVLTIQPNPNEDLGSQINEELNQKLLKLRIPRACKTLIRSELSMFMLNEAKLFPGLEAVCRDVAIDVLGRFA